MSRKRGKIAPARLQAGQARVEAAVADTRFSERRNSSLVKARARRRVKHRGSITLPIALVDVGSVTALVGVGVSTAAG